MNEPFDEATYHVPPSSVTVKLNKLVNSDNDMALDELDSAARIRLLANVFKMINPI